MLEGPSRYVVKPCAPLLGIREPDLGHWFADVQNFNTNQPEN